MIKNTLKSKRLLEIFQHKIPPSSLAFVLVVEKMRALYFLSQNVYFAGLMDRRCSKKKSIDNDRFLIYWFIASKGCRPSLSPAGVKFNLSYAQHCYLYAKYFIRQNFLPYAQLGSAPLHHTSIPCTARVDIATIPTLWDV